jgi:DNA-binding XRE family transcriptional regulator
MTQADLAGRVGVTRQTIIAIEQGKFVIQNGESGHPFG